MLDAVQPAGPCDWMSLLILLDQMPRNCYRGASSSVVFNEFDPLARDVARAAIQLGVPDDPEIRWQFGYRSWFYMPLMHSENFTDHELALEGFKGTLADLESLAAEEVVSSGEYHGRAIKVVSADVNAAREMIRANVNFEQMHYDIIKRFGRYPHRNEALGRTPTAQETEYLKNGGHTFGQSS
jgi:uncharacterized protein (DUF924 family)